MRDSTKQQIDQLLDSFEASRRQKREEEDKTATMEQAFLDAFASEIAEEIIVPELTQLGEHLKARGYAYEITQQPEYYQHRDRVKESVVFRVAVGTSFGSETDDAPRLRYTCDVERRKVAVDYSTVTKKHGGSSGSIADYTVDEISRESVERDATTFLSKLLSAH